MALQATPEFQNSFSSASGFSNELKMAIRSDPEFMAVLRRYNSGADKKVRHDVYGVIEAKLSSALITVVIGNLDAIFAGAPTIH